MPFIKRYPDGAVFDYEHGHRTAETVARQKADGTYTEPVDDEKGLKHILAFLLIVAGVALIVLAILSDSLSRAQMEADKQAIEQQLENASQGTVLDQSFFGNHLLLSMPAEGANSILKCEIERYSVEDVQMAAIFCSPGSPASLVVELPRH